MSGFLGDLPRLFPRPEQTIAGIGRLLRAGEVSCVGILNACLEQVDAWESKVHAWVVLDREGAMAQARALDEEMSSGKDRGPLHGIPIGVKDIFDVKGFPTACGARRWADRVVSTDAHPVVSLRSAGAVILGKTVTTPYAWIDPPSTRNPWNLDRSPGGSSSGSAAAVASGMCFAALGSQTGGSITRPASFCGVAGMKPSRAIASADPHEHVFPLAPSLDHVGFLARGTDDLRILFDAMRGHYLAKIVGLGPERGFRFGGAHEGPRRFVRLRGFFDRRADPAVRAALDRVVVALEAAGAEVRDVEDPVDFEQILVDHRRVMASEAAFVHTDDFGSHPDDYPPRISALIEEGRSVRAPDYIKTTRGLAHDRIPFAFLFGNGEVDAILTPATVGTATDPSVTGDPAFNSPWSYTGLPTVSFPIGRAEDGLPLAIQLVGRDSNDDDLLDAASWSEDALRSSQS